MIWFKFMESCVNFSLFLIVAPMDLTSPSKLSNQHFRNMVHVMSAKYLIRSSFAGKYGEYVLVQRKGVLF